MRWPNLMLVLGRHTLSIKGLDRFTRVIEPLLIITMEQLIQAKVVADFRNLVVGYFSRIVRLMFATKERQKNG